MNYRLVPVISIIVSMALVPSSASAWQDGPTDPQEQTLASELAANKDPAVQKPEQSETISIVPKNLALPPPPVDPNEYKVKSEVDIVLLDVAVKNKNGGFVSGLDKEDFDVFENKVPQDISIFASQDAPVTVGLVVDNSGSVRPKKAEVVTAALTFVTQSNPKDEMFIVNFNDRVAMGLPDSVPFTDDHNILRQALLMSQPQGRTALYDALKLSLKHLEQGRLDKKTLVLISDGGDNMSETTEDEIMRQAERSLATIYTVGIFNPRDKDKNPGFLKRLARLTGGEYYDPENINHLVGVCEKIAHDIRNRYTVGYSPKQLEFDGKPRRLKVIAKDDSGRELEARTRTHYIPVRPSTASRKSQ
jgi:VWFA-related protein